MPYIVIAQEDIFTIAKKQDPGCEPIAVRKNGNQIEVVCATPAPAPPKPKPKPKPKPESTDDE